MIMFGGCTRLALSVVGGLFLFLVAAPAVKAEPAPIGAFVGTFAGTGVAETFDNIYAPESVRDLDVTIARVGEGFSVTWTTVVRSAGGKVKRKTQTLDFTPTGAGSQYRSARLADAFGDGLAWAGIEEQTLSVFVLNIDTDGGYQLQRYARALTALGMDLTFTRKIDGEDLRVVKAKLIRNK
jgi:hypothetical protein